MLLCLSELRRKLIRLNRNLQLRWLKKLSSRTKENLVHILLTTNGINFYRNISGIKLKKFNLRGTEPVKKNPMEK